MKTEESQQIIAQLKASPGYVITACNYYGDKLFTLHYKSKKGLFRYFNELWPSNGGRRCTSMTEAEAVMLLTKFDGASI